MTKILSITATFTDRKKEAYLHVRYSDKHPKRDDWEIIRERTTEIRVNTLISRIIPSDGYTLPGVIHFDRVRNIHGRMLAHEWRHDWGFARYGPVEGSLMYLLRIPFGGTKHRNGMEQDCNRFEEAYWKEFAPIADLIREQFIEWGYK